MVALAKDRIDVGMYTDQLEASRTFWGTAVALPYEELLKVGAGVHQHRFGLRGSVCKVNAVRDALSSAPTGFRRLIVADERVSAPTVLRDPEGTAVELVPPGHGGVADIGVEWATTSPERLGGLLEAGFGAHPEGAQSWRLGTTLLRLVADPDIAPVGPMQARGFRYLTVQVRDVRLEHARLLAAGWLEGRAPVKLGDVAFISFVRDFGGSWIEVSQRASLTGALP